MLRFAGVLVVLLVAACGRAVPPAAGPVADPSAEVRAALDASVDGWNRGDLDAFMAPYRESAQTTFVGSSGIVRGKTAIREIYQRSYFREGRPAQRLRFDAVEVRPLGPGHAVAVGRWALTDPDATEPRHAGIFSLVLERTPEGWKIVHDHSS